LPIRCFCIKITLFCRNFLQNETIFLLKNKNFITFAADFVKKRAMRRLENQIKKRKSHFV